MSIRIRKTGEIVCAAMFPAQDEDIYIDDHLHYYLAVKVKVLIADPDHKINGLWYWR